jgi:hypothetical protein
MHPVRPRGANWCVATKKNRKPPWKRSAPKKARHTKLTPKSKQKAKAAAKRGGRKYPNLVDNMSAARKQRRK